MKSLALDEAARVLADLPALDRKSLAQVWVKAFGCPAPRGTQASLLRSALAWHYQLVLEANGEVDRLIRSLRRQLNSAAPTETLALGTRLLREWHGTTPPCLGNIRWLRVRRQGLSEPHRDLA